ncbi:hypothetical protein PG997_011582 [Apiospora hydei]|uniref:Heterokaryon incompatibility domain-containing protein n=1 Tax=Apiospora hydei TaxID=1337664 RepID=A0ABR1VJH0_9PEZI
MYYPRFREATDPQSPLNQSPDYQDIRLLFIEPARSDESRVSCRVEYHNTSEADWSPQWREVVASLGRPVRASDRLKWRKARPDVGRYTWVPIFLDGHDFQVTRNLERALRNLRDSNTLSERFLLWVDALCINQDDAEERAVQVARMQTIYTSAIETVVFLGSGDPAVEAALRFINAAGSAWNDPPKLHVAIDKYLAEATVNIGDQIIALVELPYWWRQWILQELVAGSDEKPFFYGKVQTTSKRIWQVFNQFERRNRHRLPRCAAFWDAVDKHPRHYRHPGEVKTFGEFGGPIGRRKFAFASDGETSMNTYQTLTTARKDSATNHRDYVYGLLGLVDKSISSHAKVDYGATVGDVYKDFTKIIIDTEKSLEILGHEEEPPYNANLGRKAICYFESLPQDSPEAPPIDLLHTKALIVDLLDGLSTANLETDFRDENKLYKGGYAEESFPTSSANANNAYMSDAALEEALWRVAGGNRDVRGIIPAPSHFKLLLSTELLEEHYDFVEKGSPNSWVNWVRRNADMKIAGKALLEHFRPAGLANMEVGEGESSIKNASSAIYRFEQACWSRRIAVTDKGYLALVPWYAQKGDSVVVLPGCSFPVLLRPLEQKLLVGNTFRLISPCYLHGVMDGELWRDVDMGARKLEDVVLV